MNVDNITSVFSVASATYRLDETENQDCVGTAYNPNLGVRAVIVADGLGSQAYAGLGARWAVEVASALIVAAPSLTEQVLHKIFLTTRVKIRERADSFCTREGISVDKSQSFGTTLIIGIENPTSLIIGYVGNGAIWHIRGNFNDFLPNQYLPWNALNYLNPHTEQNKAGKEALYRLISISDDNDETVPTILKIEKDRAYGDILMICTDGVYSCDQLDIGRYKDGSVWTKAEPSIVRFFAALNEFFDSPERLTDSLLQQGLNRYLSRMRADSLLDDDASMGVIATSATLGYQWKRKDNAAI